MVTAVLLIFGTTCRVHAQAPDPKAFTAAFKAALEASDMVALKSHLYTDGAEMVMIGAYQMMVTGEAGGNVTSIDMIPLSGEAVAKAMEPRDMPGGMKLTLPLTPTHKLSYTVDMGGEGSMKSSTETFVAIHNGKFVIPVPVTAK